MNTKGCSAGFVAVNIPPQVDLARVAEFLTETGIRWEYANPRYSDLFDD